MWGPHFGDLRGDLLREMRLGTVDMMGIGLKLLWLCQALIEVMVQSSAVRGDMPMLELQSRNSIRFV